jgi:hypothetical protein
MVGLETRFAQDADRRAGCGRPTHGLVESRLDIKFFQAWHTARESSGSCLDGDVLGVSDPATKTGNSIYYWVGVNRLQAQPVSYGEHHIRDGVSILDSNGTWSMSPAPTTSRAPAGGPREQRVLVPRATRHRSLLVTT